MRMIATCGLLCFSAAALLHAPANASNEETTTAENPSIGTPDLSVPVYRGGTSVLVDNGPLVNFPGGGIGGADASRVQNVTLAMTTLGAAHASAGTFRVADDFTVPAGGWDIDAITFFAYQTGSPTTSSMTGVFLQIWDGQPDAVGSNVVFGGPATNCMTATAFTGIFRDAETTAGDGSRPIMANTCGSLGLSLAAGTYWLDWSSSGSLASGPWAPPITINGQTTTGNAQQSNAGTWGPLNDGGSLTQQGLPFIIEGNVPGGDLVITVTSTAGADLQIGDSFQITVTGTNNGPSAVDNVDFTTTFNNALMVSGNDCGATPAGNTYTWNVASVPFPGSTDCTFDVSVVSRGAATANASFTADNDVDAGNNAAVGSFGLISVSVPSLNLAGLLALAGLLGFVALWQVRRQAG